MIPPNRQATDERPGEAKLNSGEHLPLRVAAFPKNPGEKPPLLQKGTLNEETTAYLFNYPFYIHRDRETHETLHLNRDGETITLYPPYASWSAESKHVKNLPLDNVPFRSDSTSPAFSWLPGPEVGSGFPPELVKADSLRIDCPKHLPYTFAVKVAEDVLGLIRCLTGQWWIKRGSDNPKTQLRHWFHCNEVGERIAGVGVFAFFFGKMGCERPLNQDVWREVVEAFAAGKRIKLSLDIAFDAIYFHACDDLRRCILEMAISNELLVAETFGRWVRENCITQQQADRFLKGSDFLSHLENLGTVSDHSFSSERPEQFVWVKAIWVARGHVAHGESPLAPLSTGTRELTLADMPAAIGAAFELREWMEALRVGGRPLS